MFQTFTAFKTDHEPVIGKKGGPAPSDRETQGQGIKGSGAGKGKPAPPIATYIICVLMAS
jgi:hypothetical protein